VTKFENVGNEGNVLESKGRDVLEGSREETREDEKPGTYKR
jgi:hypothetical protein